MRIFYLTIKKKYFDEIKSGKKKTEYRWFKKYWNDRFMKKDGSIMKFDAIMFCNGYAVNSPKVLVECRGLHFEMAKTELGKGMQWFIELGNIIEG